MFLRFFSNSFGSGLGFHFAYESTNVSHWSYNFGACGGNFNTPNGILTSPSYPDNYPDNSDCIYTISQPVGTLILLKIDRIDIEYGYSITPFECAFDYLEIRDGASEYSPLIDQYCGGGPYLNSVDGPLPMPATNLSHLFLPIQTTQENAWLRYTFYEVW